MPTKARWLGAEIHWTFKPLECDCNCIGMPPELNEVNIQGALREFIRFLSYHFWWRWFYWKCNESIAFNYDTLEIKFLIFEICFRRPAAYFQIGEKQHCKWKLVGLRFGTWCRVYKSYLSSFCGEVPTEIPPELLHKNWR